jgi:hypothetical protein
MDGTFRPNDVPSRAQAITVLTCAATDGKLLEDPGQIDAILAGFEDVNLVPNLPLPPSQQRFRKTSRRARPIGLNSASWPLPPLHLGG